jgi:AcrR family transcriptional regulator
MTKKELREIRIEEITNAAMDIFLKKGYENTSMEKIAANAGMSKGGLYHYFKSKDIILLFVNQKINRYIEEIMYETLEMTSVKKGILFYMENYLKYWLEHPKETSFLFLSVTKILENKELLQYYKKYTVDYISFLESVFNMGIRQGEFEPHNARNSAISLMAALDGVLGYMLFDEYLILEDVLQSFEEKFIKSIEKSD